jgi:hypothetical protein
VAALLQRSTDLLDKETRQRFAYLGLFVPKPATFDLDAMAVAWSVTDPRPTARLLVNRGLLEPAEWRQVSNACPAGHARPVTHGKVQAMTLAETTAFHQVEMRLARYYLNKLRTACVAIQHGQAGSTYGLDLLDKEWRQIEHWQSHSAARRC